MIFDPTSEMKAKQSTCEILAKYINDDTRRCHPDSKYELHYTDMLYRNNVYSDISQQDLGSMIDEVFDLILDLRPVLMVTAVQKTQMCRVYGNNAENYTILAIRSLISRFSKYVLRDGKIGSIVYDAEEYKTDSNLRTNMSRWRRYGTESQETHHEPRDDMLPNILNTLNLCPSEMSPGLQLTDFCARSIWLHLQRNQSTRFEQIKMLFDGSAGRDGLHIVPNEAEWIE